MSLENRANTLVKLAGLFIVVDLILFSLYYVYESLIIQILLILSTTIAYTAFVFSWKFRTVRIIHLLSFFTLITPIFLHVITWVLEIDSLNLVIGSMLVVTAILSLKTVYEFTYLVEKKKRNVSLSKFLSFVGIDLGILTLILFYANVFFRIDIRGYEIYILLFVIIWQIPELLDHLRNLFADFYRFIRTLNFERLKAMIRWFFDRENILGIIDIIATGGIVVGIITAAIAVISDSQVFYRYTFWIVIITIIPAIISFFSEIRITNLSVLFLLDFIFMGVYSSYRSEVWSSPDLILVLGLSGFIYTLYVGFHSVFEKYYNNDDNFVMNSVTKIGYNSIWASLHLLVLSTIFDTVYFIIVPRISIAIGMILLLPKFVGVLVGIFYDWKFYDRYETNFEALMKIAETEENDLAEYDLDPEEEQLIRSIIENYHLTDIDIFSKDQRIDELKINNLRHRMVPEPIFKLTHLKKLEIKRGKIEDLDHQIEKLTELEELIITFTNLGQLPSEIAKLSKLRGLNIAFNEFDAIPEIIMKLSGLENLTISMPYHVTELEEWIFSLPQLKKLIIWYNYESEVNHVKQKVEEIDHTIDVTFKIMQLS